MNTLGIVFPGNAKSTSTESTVESLPPLNDIKAFSFKLYISFIDLIFCNLSVSRNCNSFTLTVYAKAYTDSLLAIKPRFTKLLSKHNSLLKPSLLGF